MQLVWFSLAALLLAAAVGMGYGDLAGVYGALRTGQHALTSASGELSGNALERAATGELDLARSCADLATAADAFHDASAGVDRLGGLLSLAESLPPTAGRVESGRALVALATEVSAAGDSLCRGLQPLAGLLTRSTNGGAGNAGTLAIAAPEAEGDTSAGRLLAALADARPELEQARLRLARADVALARLPIEEQDARTRASLATLSTKLPALRGLVDALLVLPEVLGAYGPRTYLLLAQNREQLQPTGGYIGTAGVVRVEQGRLTHQEFGTSVRYDLPPDRLVPPPAPMARYLQASYWQLRDSNWWADFPSTAEQAAYFYNQVANVPLDGVIAFDQRTLELLLEQTGPVSVPEYGETVSAANLQERLDAYVHAAPGRDDEWQRKAIVGAVATALLHELTTMPPARLPAFAGAVSEALARKHLLMYVGAPAAAQLAAELNWDGHLYQGPGDYVYAVSANVGPNKIDPYVARTARYTVDLTTTPPRARLTLELTNRFDPAASAPWPTTNYRDYLRVYVPWESVLQDAHGFADGVETAAECGRTVFAGLVELVPGASTTVVLDYTLNPAVLDGGAYTLTVQKQPGLDPVPFTAEVIGTAGPSVAEGALARDRQYRLDAGGALVEGALPPPAAAGVACATPKPPAAELAPPTRLAIPRIGVDAPISWQQVRPTGEMEVPVEGESVGWYEASARPGYAGNFVAAAHVDWSKRPAVFWRLHELRPGDQVVVSDARGDTHTYAVEWNRAIRPEDTPIGDLVGPSHDKLLTLITCSGNFNQVTHDYSHRQIVRARLLESGG